MDNRARNSIVLTAVWKKDIKNANLGLLENRREVQVEKTTEYKVRSNNITLQDCLKYFT